MRAVCNTEMFSRKLQLVSRGVSARSTIQLLGGSSSRLRRGR